MKCYVSVQTPLCTEDEAGGCMCRTYGVDAQTVSVGDVEGVILVRKDYHVRQRIHPQGVVVRPVHWADVQGQGCQVTLR